MAITNYYLSRLTHGVHLIWVWHQGGLASSGGLWRSLLGCSAGGGAGGEGEVGFRGDVPISHDKGPELTVTITKIV